MKRIGALLVFKPNVTQEQARAALSALQGLTETRITYPHTTTRIIDGQRTEVVDFNRPVKTDNPADAIETYDDAYGGPVWYIP